jgi:hypothetical protein
MLVFTSQSETGMSDLYIIDAATMDPSPVAIIRLPGPVPRGFHALWVPEDKYQSPTGATRQNFAGLDQEPADLPPLPTRTLSVAAKSRL